MNSHPIVQAGLIVPGANFDWNEVTNGGRYTVPEKYIMNVLRLTHQVQTYRAAVGRPFIITSWYRPPEVNAAVGGSSRSWHMAAGAIDFWVPGMSPGTVAGLFIGWPGGIGVYSSWLHVDIGPSRRWNG